jgi:NAD(P)-dependent dehydrogenase (short-subunit alcohol dehydrogenase family)
MTLNGQTILITGAARRVGRHLALSLAKAGANIILHHSNSPLQAEQTATEIEQFGRKAWILQADFRDPQQAASLLQAAWQCAPLNAVIHNASIFEPIELSNTSLQAWQEHLNVNLTAPFLISQAFAATLPAEANGRIITLLDWRSLRPGSDHFPYTISKAALAALTRSLAVALAPRILVNGLALGAILPPSDGADTSRVLENVPAGRWADLDEVNQAALFLLTGPAYLTGEIIHLDGGRHLL